ncbi:MAG: zinc ribbon domain-containing protein [Proteobacteria bacterium]|nr:zinc ribbon domain-containing protein [Pseudomonadota bacterium]
MPIYEYECTNCGKIEEAIQKISDKPLVECSHCSGKLQKLISQGAFHLKGGGWYADSYGKKPGSASDTSKKTSSKNTCEASTTSE